MSVPYDYLHRALVMALLHRQDVMGEEFTPTPQLHLYDDNSFWALIALRDDALRIEVSAGFPVQVRDLWTAALDAGVFKDGAAQTVVADIDVLTTVSLAWLMMHEMEHYALGHFAIADTHRIGEAGDGDAFGLVARAGQDDREWPLILGAVSDVDRHLIAPCLEMQADHDALEMLLEGYSSTRWDELRLRLTCIIVTMILIERADAVRGDTHSSHPKAATRIFQLLGHVAQMPTLLGAPTAQAEINRYTNQVVMPAIADAKIIARCAGSLSTLNDLVDEQAFVTDIGQAMLGKTENLQTVGAKQWAELERVNQVIAIALGFDRDDVLV